MPAQEGDRRAGRWTGALAAVVAVAVAVEQVRIWRSLSARYVTDDQALLWTAAREWGRGRPHSPFFWGQRYGVTLEAIPAEVLRVLGVSLRDGVPLGLIAMGLATWWLPAAALWWRGRRALSIGFLAAPAFLVPDHSIMISVFCTGAGRLAAGAATAVWIAWPRRTGTAGAVVALGGLALIFDSSTAIAVAPLLVLTISHVRWTRAGLALTALGAAVPVGWWAMARAYLEARPDEDLHPSPQFDPAWHILRDNAEHLGRHFDLVAPQLAPSPVSVVVLAVLALAALLAVRAWWGVAAWIVGVAVTAVILSVPKSLDGFSTVYFRPGRMVLVVPLFLATVVVAAADRGWRPPIPVAPVVAGVALATLAVRAVVLPDYLDRLAAQAEADRGYPVQHTEEVLARCDEMAEVAEAAGVRLAVFHGDRTTAYACAGVHTEITTLFPSYERRTWLLRRLAAEPAEALVMWDLPAALCGDATWQAVLTDCQPMGEGIVLRFTPRPPIQVLHELHLEVRPFGPGCEPQHPATCA